MNDINDHKRYLAEIYLKNLNDNFIKPVVKKNHFDVYHIFNIRHKRRDDLRKYMLKNGVITEIHYPIPPHKQKSMRGIFSENYPISEEIHQSTLSLPISYFHTKKNILKICEILNSYNF